MSLEIEQINKRFDAHDKRFDEQDRWLEEFAIATQQSFQQIDERFEEVDRRFVRIEEKLIEHDKKFDHLTHLIYGIGDTLAQMMQKMEAEFAAARIQKDRLSERVDYLEHIHGIS